MKRYKIITRRGDPCGRPYDAVNPCGRPYDAVNPCGRPYDAVNPCGRPYGTGCNHRPKIAWN